MKNSQKQTDEFEGKTCDLIAMNQNHIDSIKMGNFTIHKHSVNGKRVISWNKIMKDNEIIPHYLKNDFNSLQEAIREVEKILDD